MSVDYDALAQDYVRQGSDAPEPAQVKLGVMSATAIAPDPDTEAAMRKAADLVGVPYDSARGNFAEVQQQARLKELNLEALPSSAPSTARYLSNPDKAAVAHDDIPSMSLLERGIAFFRSPKQRKDVFGASGQLWESGLANLAAGADRSRAAIQQFDADNPLPWTSRENTERARLEAERARLSARGNEAVGRRQIAGEVSWPDFKADPVVGNLLGYIYGSAAKSVPGRVQAAANPLFATLGNAANIGQQRAENDGRQDATLGDVGVSAPFAAAVTALDRAGLAGIFKAPGKGAVSRVATATGQEGVTEGVQSALEYAGGTLGTDKPFDLAEMGDQALAGAVAGAGMGGGVRTTIEATTLGRHLRQQEKAADSVQNADALDTIAQASQQSRLRERSPEDFKTFVREAAERGPVQEVYVAAETLQQAMSTPEGQQALQAMPEVAAQVEVAQATGQDIKIPVEDFATHIAPLPNYAAIADHLKTEPEGMTRAEAQEAIDKQVDTLRADFDRVLAEKQYDDQFKASQQKVHDAVKAQLETTARFTSDVNSRYAELASRFFAVQASRLNITPEEMFARYPLRVTAGDGAVIGGALTQAFDLGYKGKDTGEAAEWMQANKRGLDMSENARLDRARKMGFDTGRILYHGTTVSFDAFRPSNNGNLGKGVYLAESPEAASIFAERLGGDGSNVIPVYVKKGAIKKSRGSAAFGNLEHVIADPSKIRSVHAAFDPKSNGKNNLLAQDGADTARGTFNPSNLTISLNKNADLSTFLHELGHFHLEVLADLASRPDAPVEIVEDMNTLLGWFGITGSEQVTGEGQAIAFAQEEVRKATPVREARTLDEAREAVQPILGKPVTNAATGLQATVSAATLRKMTSEKAHLKSSSAEDHALALANVDHLFANAVLDHSHPDAKGEPTIRAIHRFVAPMVTAGGVRAVKMTVKETAHPDTPNPLYTIEAIEMAKPERGPGETGLSAYPDETGNTPRSNFAEHTIAHLDTVRKAYEQSGDEGTPGPLPAGRTALDVWNAMSLDEKRVYHEKFARGFETYLFEGKAPSLSLKKLFQRFSSWLVSIYRQATNLRAELSDEVRGVMDRLVATRDEIAETESLRAFTNPFTEKPEGMTDAEWQDLNDLSAQATLDAQTALQSRSLRDMKWLEGAKGRELRRLQREAAEKRKAVKEEVEAEVMAEPVNQARRFLTHGELNGAPVEGAHKLDLFTVKELFPQIPEAEIVKALGTGKYGMLAEGGAHPDIVAEMFGYSSGQGLIHHLLTDEPAKAKIRGLTDQRMLEQYGDLIDPESISRAADEAVHNTARIRFMATALAALDKSLGDRNVLMASTKALASQVVGRQKLRDLRPDLYTAAEARAGRAVLKAMKAGDLTTAAAEMRKQLFNAQAAKAAYAARDSIRKGEAFFGRITAGKDDSLSKSRNMDLVNASRQILEAYGYDRAKNDPTAYMDLVKEYDPVLYADINPFVDAALAAAPASQDPRDLTLDEFNALRDTVAQVYELARRSQQMRREGKLVDLDEVVKETAADLPDGPGPYAEAGVRQAIGKAEETRTWLLGNVALLRRVEDWAVAKGKAFHRNIYLLLSDASLEYRTLSTKYRKQLLDNLEAIREDLKPTRIEAPELNYTFGAATSGGMGELIGALRHTGNESNLEKLLVGRGWATYARDGSLDTARWDAFLARMHASGTLQKRHWDYVQSEWNLHEEVKPLVQKAHRAVYGRYFAEIEAKPVDTPFGQYAGGYVPATTDPRIVDEQLMRQDEAALLGGAAGSFMFPTPASGFTKARNANYTQALALDLQLAGSQIEAALKFATLAEPVRDVLRLIKAKDLAGKLKSYDPTAATDLLLPWLQRTAAQSTAGTFSGKAGRGNKAILDTIRQRAVMAMMFGNLTNTLMNVTGLAPAMLRTGKRNMAGAMFHYLRNPARTAKEVAGASPFMAERMTNQMVEMHDAVREITTNPSLLEKAQAWSLKHTYFLQRALQSVIDQVVWTAGYNRAVERGEVNPVAYADMVVRTTQGSNNAVDVSRFETGSPLLKVFTTFSGYFLGQANLIGTEFAKAKARKSPAGVLNVYLLGILAPSFGAELIRMALAGGLKDDEDDGPADELLQLFIGSQLTYVGAMVPVAGPAINALVNRATGKATDSSISVSPVVSIAEGAIGVPFGLYQLAQGKGNTQKVIRDTATLVTLLTGIPLTLVARPAGYAAGVAAGEIEPTDTVDATRGTLTGTASPESRR